MRCSRCNFENEPDAQFCEECGSKLVLACPGCGREVRPTAKFCRQCGTALSVPATAAPQRSSPTTPAASAQPQPEPRSPEAERRQLTVMFCDLVDSTALSARLDPEELREVVRLYQDTCTTVIQRYEGYIAQHLGDGLLVYFGYPAAHEDDAQRAVRAGIEIIDALRASPLQHRQLPTPLQVRIGIHTGLVVIGEIGSGAKREMLALGETPNIAARVQGVAEPDTIVMSARTYRLVQGLFECQGLGSQTLKGISTSLVLYRVLAESGAQSRFEVAVRAGLTPLVGREEELGLLRRRWDEAKAGDGQVVLLSGEPGIGKSRLVQELKEQVRAEGATCIEFRCAVYHQNSAFYPLVAHLQRRLHFTPHDSPPAKLDKLAQALASYRFPQADTVPLLAALLSLPHPAGAVSLTMSPQKLKEKTQDALVAWVVEDAASAPVFCAWEDLQWADPSTVEVLTRFLDQVPLTRVLAVLTCRPEFTPSWGARAYLSPLTLSCLARPHVAALVEGVTRGKALPAEVLQQVVMKTDGVPLFVEELTKMVLEAGLLSESEDHYELSGPLPPLAIPSTLQDSLMARLDRLAPVRELAQVGAVLGREFSYELLRAVSSVDEKALQEGLRQLVTAELVYQRGVPPQATYLFKHALVQDAAYQSMLKSARQQYHQQTAQVLEGRFPETVESQPELVAQHYTEASLIEQAIPYWQKAGERAARRSAYVEAISHLTRGLELLKVLPDTPERANQELRLLQSLGPALVSLKGYGALEVEQSSTRAYALSQQVGRPRQLFEALLWLRLVYLSRGNIHKAREVAEQCVQLAERGSVPTALLLAHMELGEVLFYLGEVTAAREHFEQSWRFYTPQEHNINAIQVLIDPGVVIRSYIALSLWYLGYPDQAQQRHQECLVLAKELAHPYSWGFALIRTCMFHAFNQEWQLAEERAEELITLTASQGFPFWLADGRALRGWALIGLGQIEEGIAQIEQGLAYFRATGTEVERIAHLPVLAAAYRRVGRVEEGLAELADALPFVNKTGMRIGEAMLYVTKGELLLARSGEHRAEAEACFRQAIEITRRQQAKSLELQAAMSLSRLWQQQGKRAEAHTLLSGIYNWFTEGFDTKDLQEARALLADLEAAQKN